MQAHQILCNAEKKSPLNMADNLDALIDRKSFYRLVDIGEHHEMNEQSWFGIWSTGEFFPIILSSELE